jgi:Dyp-type peroxidase family
MAKTQLKDPAGVRIAVNEIQGDVLIGLQKNFEAFVFFQILDVAKFKSVVRSQLGLHVTTTGDVAARERQLEALKAAGRHETLPLIGVNIAFTAVGLGKLVPGTDLGDPSFALGAQAQAALAGDPVDGSGTPVKWKPQFLGANIDGVLLVTGGTEDAVDGEVAQILSFLGTAISVAYSETGHVRPGAENGHEHFGWKDGISQPGVEGLTDPFPGQQTLDPGTFVFGYGASTDPPVSWMSNGSFMVFRRLEQLVPEFDAFLISEANRLGTDPVLLGARLVGRWKSGAPMELTPVQDDGILGGDASRNNDFDYSDDQGQLRCPFGAHIRKTNPRADIPPFALDPHRVIRAGIPFGPEVNAAESASGATAQERGLMFVCYQTSIPNGFEFIQRRWANEPRFVSNFVAKNRPGTGGAVIAAVGFDPIIGQNAAAPDRSRTMDEPVSNYPSGMQRSELQEPIDFVVPTAGAYFFVPSISALLHVLTAPLAAAAASVIVERGNERSPATPDLARSAG